MIVYRELSSLTKDLGFSAKALYSLSNHASSHYYQTRIPKGNGEYRELSVPDRFLKAVQKKILQKLLLYEEVSPYATAYRFGGSTVKNAIRHIGQNKILKLDIRHFFDHIIYPVVKDKVFDEKKYSEKNRILLSLICLHNDALPQGAPTSPAISNIIMRDFDNKVGQWCRDKEINYTRYCDDMTFSGDFDHREVAGFVRNELGKMGFYLNESKTVLACRGQKQIITGITVNEKINTPLSYRKSIRQEMYYCKTFGVKSHLQKKQIDISEQDYLRKLHGRVNYVLAVDSGNTEMREYKEQIAGWLKSFD